MAVSVIKVVRNRGNPKVGPLAWYALGSGKNAYRVPRLLCPSVLFSLMDNPGDCPGEGGMGCLRLLET